MNGKGRSIVDQFIFLSFFYNIIPALTNVIIGGLKSGILGFIDQYQH